MRSVQESCALSQNLTAPHVGLASPRNGTLRRSDVDLMRPKTFADVSQTAAILSFFFSVYVAGSALDLLGSDPASAVWFAAATLFPVAVIRTVVVASCRGLNVLRYTAHRHMPHIAVLSLLCMVRWIALLLAVQVVGPTRVLVVAGVVAPMLSNVSALMCPYSATQSRSSTTSSRSLPLLSLLSRESPASSAALRKTHTGRAARNLFMILVACWLVAYDATGGRSPAERAATVTRRVLKSHTGDAVRERWRHIASNVRSHAKALSVPPMHFTSRMKQVDALKKAYRNMLASKYHPLRFSVSTTARDASPQGTTNEQQIQMPLVPAPKIPSPHLPRSHQVPVSEQREISQFTASFLARSTASSSGTVGVAFERRKLLSEDASLVHGVDKSTFDRADRSVASGQSESASSDGTRFGRVLSQELWENVADSKSTHLDDEEYPVVWSSAEYLERVKLTLWLGWLGVALALLSFASHGWYRNAQTRCGTDAADEEIVSTMALLGAAVCAVICASIFMIFDKDPHYLDVLQSDSWTLFAHVGSFSILGMLLPIRIDQSPACRRPRTPRGRPLSRRSGDIRGVSSGFDVAVQTIQSSDSDQIAAAAQYDVFALGQVLIRLVRFTGFYIEPFTFCLWMSAAISWMLLRFGFSPAVPSELGQHAGSARYPPLTSEQGSVFARQFPKFASTFRVLCSRVIRSRDALHDFFSHAQTHKASWQVLNFLILQSGMVLVESSYAFVTSSMSLISISADNLFCCTALAGGLFCIRVISLCKAPSRFSHGLARLESLCGFMNSVLLIVVAMLIVLEAVDRALNPELVEASHVLAVCLFGIVGNGLGLYFFPPETRRENHNVQGIYLHIWANTLAYVGVSSSTLLLQLRPKWIFIELTVSSVVALFIVFRAIPLLVRSSRLLIDLPPSEKACDPDAMRNKLEQIDSAVRITGLRVWHMTPSVCHVTAELCLSSDCRAEDMTILSSARAALASFGVLPCNATIQISRGQLKTSHSMSNLRFDGGNDRCLAASFSP